MELITIDFSKETDLNNIISHQLWQRKIFHFIKQWNSKSVIIKCKTSGSTKKPRIINLQKSWMIQSAINTINHLKLSKGAKALLCLSPESIAGKMMIVRAILFEMRLICMEPKSNINITEFIDFVSITPMQAHNSIDSLSNFRNILIGGAPVSVLLEKKLHNLTSVCYESFGMTETVSHFALRNISNRETCFTVLKGVKIKSDQENCLFVKLPWSKEYFKTNDIIKQIDAHKFIWVGRKDFVINSGGIKLHPEKIENELKKIIKCNFIVMGVPDKILGEKLILIVEGDKIMYTNLLNQLKDDERICKFHIPKEIRFVSKLKYLKSGKINRKVF